MNFRKLFKFAVERRGNDEAVYRLRTQEVVRIESYRGGETRSAMDGVSFRRR